MAACLSFFRSPFLAALLLASPIVSGCAGPEQRPLPPEAAAASLPDATADAGPSDDTADAGPSDDLSPLPPVDGPPEVASRPVGAAASAAAVPAAFMSAVPSQPPTAPLPQPPDGDGRTIDPEPVRVTPGETSSPGGPAVMQLDLADALALANGRNPRIALAAARYREAYARVESARVLWLPSIRAGVSFNHHDGTLQASDGKVLDASRSSLQGGLGLQAVGAGSPMVPGLVTQFHASDSLYQPKIAGYAAAAESAAARAVANDTSLRAALAYLDVLQATQALRIAEETQKNARQLAELTATFARTGQGPQADADRMETELVARTNDVARAHERQQVAHARLAEVLSLEPTQTFAPQEPTMAPVQIVDGDAAPAELIATGLSNRPELAEARSLVCEAVNRYRREKHAPLLPSVLLGLSQSSFGGGLGGEIDDWRGRFDVDAAVFWELRNFGLGDRARRNETRARYQQARSAQAALLDRVAREIVEAQTQVRARRGQIQLAEAGVSSATKSYRRNSARIRQGQGLPVEVLQSLQALDAARREYLRTIADYNAAQFRLQRALGWPVS